MHQANHKLQLTWTLEQNTNTQEMRHCPGCGKKTAFEDSGVRRHNANGKKITQWAIYKCEKGHTWNKTLGHYRAAQANAISDPGSLERHRYGRVEEVASIELSQSRLTEAAGILEGVAPSLIPLDFTGQVEITIAGQTKGNRLDKVIHQRCNHWGRTEIQKMIKGGQILVNGQGVKPGAKLKVGDVVCICVD